VRGRTHVCRLEAAPLAEAHDWLGTYQRFWTGRLDILEQLLRAEDAQAAARPKSARPKPKPKPKR
jgi:hypothetical protein